MTAPTTRETADHAELLEKLKRVKYVREAHDEPHGTYDQPCDADDYGAEAVPVNPDGEAAADALENLLSEIAALRGAKWDVQHVDTMNDMVLMGMARDEALTRLTQAERQRDEAVGLLRELWQSVYYDTQRSPAAPITLGTIQKADAARAFLANQGADQ